MEEKSVCPKCGQKLWHLKRRSMLVEHCSGCGGIWFDAGELTVLLEVHKSLDAVAGTGTDWSCVRCGAKLVERPFPGTKVAVDSCPSCNGVWLDRGEFEALKTALLPLVPKGQSLQERAKTLLADLEKATRGCPGCGGELVDEHMKTIPVERCAECSGLWFDAGELAKVLGVFKKIPLKEATAVESRCLKCPDQKLVDARYPGTDVGILVCPDCRGTWVGAAALDQIKCTLGGG